MWFFGNPSTYIIDRVSACLRTKHTPRTLPRMKSTDSCTGSGACSKPCALAKPFPIIQTLLLQDANRQLRSRARSEYRYNTALYFVLSPAKFDPQTDILTRVRELVGILLEAGADSLAKDYNAVTGPSRQIEIIHTKSIQQTPLASADRGFQKDSQTVQLFTSKLRLKSWQKRRASNVQKVYTASWSSKDSRSEQEYHD